MNFGCRFVEMIQDEGLEVEFLVSPPFIGDFEDVAPHWGFDSGILIFVRIKRGNLTPNAVKIHGDCGELIAIK